MKKTNYIKPFIKVRALGAEAVLLGNSGLKEQSDGTFVETDVTKGNEVKGEDALSKGNLWGVDEEDE